MNVNAHPFLQAPLDLSKVDKQLVDAAKGMEANFIKQMMRVMRESVNESEAERNDKALQLFRGMLDDHYAEAAAENNSIGIAELIIRHLTQQTDVPAEPIRSPIENSSDPVGKVSK